jgi:hypothetical protein
MLTTDDWNENFGDPTLRPDWIDGPPGCFFCGGIFGFEKKLPSDGCERRVRGKTLAAGDVGEKRMLTTDDWKDEHYF